MINPNVNNEWGDLKEIIVGSATNARVPSSMDFGLHCVDYAHLSEKQFTSRVHGVYPSHIIDETNEDLDNIVNVLEKEGIKVYRPIDKDFSETNSHGVDQYYNYCPRDSMLVIENKVIATPMALRNRADEAENYKSLFNPTSWVQAPKPALLNSIYQRDNLNIPTLLDGEPVFDAANIIKHNSDLLYLVSNTGNLSGAKWLENYCKETFGNHYKVHTVENVYAYIHIDTTFVFLREGLVLLNPSRVNDRNMPEFLKPFDKIWAPEPYPTQVMEDWCPASPWLSMNILPISDKLVMVEEHQTNLMRQLKKYGIDSIPVKLRHARTFSGGPHCITLDVVRND